MYYNYFRFDDEETFDEYYSNIKKMSVYDTGVEAKYGDEILTLSTCSYHTKDGRLAVIARKTSE
jgi:sortase B